MASPNSLRMDHAGRAAAGVRGAAPAPGACPIGTAIPAAAAAAAKQAATPTTAGAGRSPVGAITARKSRRTTANSST